MTDVIRIVGFGLVFTVIAVFLRETYEEYAIGITIAFATIILMILLVPLGQILDLFHKLSSGISGGQTYIEIVLKVIAVSYLTGFGAQISKDAGEDTIAATVELAGKVVILLIAVPVIAGVLDKLVGLLVS